MQRATALMRAGGVADAASLCRQILEMTPGHPEALHVLAVAARKTGDLAAAEACFRESLAHAPGQPAVLVDYGNLMRALGRVAEAESLHRQAIALRSDFAPAWHNLGVLLHAAGRYDEAAQCATRATALARKDAAAWQLLAAAEQGRGDLAAAIAACRAGIRATPAAAKLHYALGQLLREDCSFAEAASAYETAQRCGYESPELYQNRGEAHFEAGDADRALAVLTQGVKRFPESALLHRLRARVHWESEAPGDPLALLRAAAQKYPNQVSLWQTLVDLLNRLDRRDEGRAALADARTLGCAQPPELRLLEAICCAQSGRASEATQLFAHLAATHPRHVGIRLAFAEHLVSAGDPARAEALCAEVLEEYPLDQLAWAFRGTAWRLLGDARESWLCDYERMVTPVCVPPPAGYGSSEEFFEAVRAVLESLHRTRTHPIEQTLRGGTQTNGFLFRLKHPILRLLEAQIRTAVRTAIASFPDVADHPFWARRYLPPEGDGFRFAGCWSVRLKSQGYHTNHIHPQGWISSALYVALPQEVREGSQTAGHLQFGVPPAETGLDLAPRRIVKPSIGELVLFPSYMWHGTVPFESEQPRMTVAFDLVPQV